MERADVEAFMSRDHRAVEALRAAYWQTWQQSADPVATLSLADGLRLHAIALHPDWPDRAERDRDLAAHLRLAELLRRAASFTGR